MNQTSSTDSSIFSSVQAPDAVSRRAYELWENEGRPEGSDLRHWLQAEQELGTGNSDHGLQAAKASGSRSADASAPRNTGTDTRPLQGTRAAAADREQKRGGSTSLPEKNVAGNSNGQVAARRKTSNAPVM